MLLNIKDLRVKFKLDSAEVEVVRGIDLQIPKGGTTALVGESGSGKSVTAMSILRLLDKVAPVETSGRIELNGRNLLELSDNKIREVRGNRIAMIFQEPMTSLNPVYNIGSQLLEPLIIHRHFTVPQARREAINLLERCGLQEAEKRMGHYPHQLSGGQRQRVMIAMSLACRPDLLIADEPTTALDVTIQAQIIQLILDLQAEFKMAVLLITHDLAMVHEIAQTVYIMHHGHLVESGPAQEVFHHPRTAYARSLLDSAPHGEPPEMTATNEPLIEIKDLRVEFAQPGSWFKAREWLTAVDGVSLQIKQGSTLGLVGESGSGKSTLGFAILRLLASRGEIDYKGIKLNKCGARRLRALRRELQIVFQDPFSSLSPRLTVGRIISEGLRVHFPELRKDELKERVEKALDEVGLDGAMAQRYPHEFSGGQRQRIAIARAIILQPRFLILDEPTSALDMTIQAQIIDLLCYIQRRYKMTYLFISHDLRVVRALANELAVMKDGKIIESGTAKEVFENPQAAYTKELFKAAFAF
ncbi:MAG TPA: ABC transporter ATP-binding protein [Desulfobacterales bacterium]|nr:ABC transporter ATP-binding protein [Desulfobacterales bacterium]